MQIVKILEMRNDMAAAEGAGNVNAQDAARTGIERMHGEARFLDLSKDRARPAIEIAAPPRQMQPPCRAVEERDAEVGFEPTDVARHRRDFQLLLGRCLGGT